MEKYQQSWQIIVSNGREEHQMDVPATDEKHAMDRALAYCERNYGTSKWRISSINGTVMLAPGDSPELADGAPYRYRSGDRY